MIEIAIVVLLVLWSSVVVFKKILPNTANRVMNAWADFAEQRNWQTLEKWLRPKASFGCAGGCGCASDDEPAGKVAEVKAVKWK